VFKGEDTLVTSNGQNVRIEMLDACDTPRLRRQRMGSAGNARHTGHHAGPKTRGRAAVGYSAA